MEIKIHLISFHLSSPHFTFHQNMIVLKKGKKRGKEVEPVVMLQSLSSMVSLTGFSLQNLGGRLRCSGRGVQTGGSACRFQAEAFGLQSSVCRVGRKIQVAGFKLKSSDCKVQPADSRVRATGFGRRLQDPICKVMLQGLGCRVQAVEFSLHDSGWRIRAAGFALQGLVCRISCRV
jgi:hypothetical protein